MKNVEKIIQSVSSIKTKEIATRYKSKNFTNKRIATFGTFDLFHIGHKKIIDHALYVAGEEKNLIIAVSSDKWNSLKGKKSYQNEKIRVAEIKKNYPNATIILEDHDAPEESWPELWDKYKFDLIIMGGDHTENLSYINDVISADGKQMKICFFERTPKISSSLLKEEIYKNK